MEDFEVWKQTQYHFQYTQTYYEVSTHGRIRRQLKNGSWKISNGRLMKVGYRGLVFTTQGQTVYEYIHRLVAIAFIDNPDNKTLVDHIDGNKHNNHVSNLRWANRSENAANQRLSKGYYKSKNKYMARIHMNGKSYHIGTYDTAEEAQQAYRTKHAETFGEFSPWQSTP